MVTHETRIREVPVSNPMADHLVEVFLVGSSILKQLRNELFFKGKCRVGPHIPLLLIQFNVYSFSRSETIVVKMVNI